MNMNIRLLLFLLMFSIIPSVILGKGLSPDILEKIYSFQKSKSGTMLAEGYKKIHRSLNKSRRLNFVEECDTLFMFESEDVATGICYISIWNKQKEINYKYFVSKQKLKKSPRKVFDNYLQKLITEWDIETLKAMESTSGIIDPMTCYSFRIVLGDTTQVEGVRFIEFRVP